MAVNEITSVDVKTLTPFKRFIMTLGELPTSYLESMTYAELVMWFCNFLQEKVIPTVNNNADALQEVITYLQNLDLQDEVDHKLDEMADDGTLQEIVADYLNSKAIFGFVNVEDMKSATNLINGSYAKTLGYYAKNDGGSALYKIREIDVSDVPDDAFIIQLSDELVAELVIENETINALQLGIKRNDNTYNAHDLILKTVQDYNVKLYFPKGSYYTSQLYFDKNCHVNLEGDSTCYEYHTIFNPYGSNNGYIIKCGGKENYSVDNLNNYTTNQLKNIKINNLTFRDWDNPISPNKYSYSCCLAIDNCSNIELNVNFYYCSCNGLLIRESWELESKYISCRGMFGNFNTCGIIMANRAITNSGSNISALMFDLLDFEQINGKCIVTERNANCSNIAINKISIENGRAANPDLLSVKVANITTDELYTYRTTYHFNPLLSFTGTAITIGTINTGYVGTCYYYKDGVSADGKYTDALLSVQGDISISTIGMPSLMTAIITKYYSNIYENVTISSFTTNPGEQFSIVGRKTAQYVYVIPEELSTNGSCTFVDVQDKKVIVDPDYVKTKGNGFWSGLDLFEFLIPHKGWQNYAIIDNKVCYNAFTNSNFGGLLNNIYVAPTKKIRMKIKALSRIVGDNAPLQLLDANDDVVATLNTSVSDWTADVYFIVEYTIPSSAYNKLKLTVSRPSVIEWIEIGD